MWQQKASRELIPANKALQKTEKESKVPRERGTLTRKATGQRPAEEVTMAKSHTPATEAQTKPAEGAHAHKAVPHAWPAWVLIRILTQTGD